MVQKHSRSLKRRQFLISVASLPVLGAPGDPHPEVSRPVADPAESSDLPLRLGLIGYGNRGKELFSQVRETQQKTHIHAVCEIFDQRLEKALAEAGKDTRGYHNYLDLLGDREIDGVIIATPDHWHAQMAQDAARAGKHIYLEKCMTRTEEEARALRDTVKKSGVVFQLGHQGRQHDLNQKARELIAMDTLGKITLIEATTNRNDPAGEWNKQEGERASASSVDWTLFQGAAAAKYPFSEDRYYKWRNYWAYGTGMAGELLSNEFDAVNSILDLGIPSSAAASGGCYFHLDGREVPDVFQVTLEYPGRGLSLLYSGTLANGVPRGTLFMGREASLELGRILSVWVDRKSEKYKSRIKAGIIDPAAPFVNYMRESRGVDAISSATAKYYADRGLDRTYISGKEVSTTGLHLSEWLSCIRNKREPSCNIDRGFEVAIAVHMATRSLQEGRTVKWDPDTQSII